MNAKLLTVVFLDGSTADFSNVTGFEVELDTLSFEYKKTILFGGSIVLRVTYRLETLRGWILGGIS